MSDKSDESSKIGPDSGLNISDLINANGAVLGTAASAIVTRTEDPASLREWWHEILRAHDRYSSYAIFLTLPSDQEALRYLMEYGRELNIISGTNCLIIALNKTAFRFNSFDEEIWRVLVKEHTSEGYSINVARLFDIDFTIFPCMLVFRDIRSPEHAIIGLTGMTAQEIATKMRRIFAIIETAVKNKKDPIRELEKQHYVDILNKKGKNVANKVSGLAERTFEAAIEAWINATLK